MERLDRPETGGRSANMTFKSDKVSGNVVLTLEDAAIGYGEEVLSEPINLDIRKFNAGSYCRSEWDWKDDLD